MSQINAASSAVLSAFAASSSDYIARCLSTRLAGSPERAGSWYEATSAAALRNALLLAEWQPYSHPAVLEPAQAFRAPLPGRNGMVALDSLPSDAVVTLIDPKGGEQFWDGKRKVSAAVSMAETGAEPPHEASTTLLVGPASKDNPTIVVWTFYPGAPCRPSEVDRIAPDGSDRHGQKITVREAIALGFDLAKLTA